MLKENIKRLREGQGMSQSELAKTIGVAPSYISGLESGSRKNPSDDIVTALAVALDTTRDELYRESISERLQKRALQLGMPFAETVKKVGLNLAYIESIDSRIPCPWDYAALKAVALELKTDPAPLLAILGEYREGVCHA